MSKNELKLIDDILSRIYTIRGVQAMLDSDLAVCYGVEVRRLNEQVKRNKERFPESFCFQLTDDDIDILKSQIATSSDGRNLKSQIVMSSWGGRRTHPYAFTEQGVAIDNATVYHFGASLKDLGKKWFAFSKMDIGAAQMRAKLGEVV